MASKAVAQAPFASKTSKRCTKRRRTARPPPGSPLLTLDRRVLTLIWQCLRWREKLVELSHVSPHLPSFSLADFRLDRLILGRHAHKDVCSHWDARDAMESMA